MGQFSMQRILTFEISGMFLPVCLIKILYADTIDIVAYCLTLQVNKLVVNTRKVLYIRC